MNLKPLVHLSYMNLLNEPSCFRIHHAPSMVEISVLFQFGVPGKSCTSGCEANWYERSLKWDEERSIRRSRS
jgi:hypothetical protein